MSKIIEWLKANPWKTAVIALALALVILAPVSYCGGYVKGCSSQAQADEK
ncbi:MAG: hypothetical protein WC374_06970 [Phycisphaerae bacterium]|jgi:hypothetical protein